MERKGMMTLLECKYTYARALLGPGTAVSAVIKSVKTAPNTKKREKRGLKLFSRLLIRTHKTLKTRVHFFDVFIWRRFNKNKRRHAYVRTDAREKKKKSHSTRYVGISAQV